VRVGFWGPTQHCPGIQTTQQQQHQHQQRGGRSFVGGKQQVRIIRSGASKETPPPPPSVSVVTRKAQKEDDIYSTLRALQSRNRHPKKWLGQHYMINEKVNTDMVEAAGIQPGDLVLEIGPGTGSLTKALVEAGAHVCRRKGCRHGSIGWREVFPHWSS